jgi:hypothetical protein
MQQWIGRRWRQLPREWRIGLGGCLGGGTAVLCLFCLLLSWAAGLSQDRTAAATAQPGRTPVAVAAAAATTPETPATATPAPSETPAPTATPRPTRTPRPTEPPQPTTDPVARAYAGEVVAATQHIAQGLQALSTLSQNPRFGDDTWTIQFAAAITLIRMGHRDLVGLTPPPDGAALHAAIIDATADCDTSMELLARGVDARDAAQISEATALMQSCNTKLGDAYPLMEAFVQRHTP